MLCHVMTLSYSASQPCIECCLVGKAAYFAGFAGIYESGEVTAESPLVIGMMQGCIALI